MKQKILLIFLTISIGLIQSFAFHHQTDDLFLKDPDITRYPVGEKILKHYTIFKLVSLFSSNKFLEKCFGLKKNVFTQFFTLTQIQIQPQRF